MKRFEYLKARTVRQVISMLQRYGGNARIVAGSTDFSGALALRRLEPRTRNKNLARRRNSARRRPSRKPFSTPGE